METLQEAARKLGIPVSSLTYYRITNKITVYQSGRNYLVDTDVLKQELEEAGYTPRKKKGEPNHDNDTKAAGDRPH